MRFLFSNKIKVSEMLEGREQKINSMNAAPEPGDAFKTEMLVWMLSLFIVIILTALWSKGILFLFGVAVIMRLKLILKVASTDLATLLQEQK